MNPKQLPGTMMDAYLRAIRRPVDGAVRRLLSAEHSRRSVLHAIDRVDASVRALSGVILHDAPLVESAQHKLPLREPADVPADKTRHARERARQPDQREPRKPRRSQHSTNRATHARDEAPPVATRVPRGQADLAGPSTDAPSFEDISLRAYELYRAGTPGTTEDHWRMAEAELVG